MAYTHIEVKHCVIPFHNLEVCCSYVKWAFRYRANSLDHEILVTVTYNHIEVKGCVIHFIIWKYDVHMSNDLQDIKQNHWTVKCRSQWLAFILRWIIVSHHFIIWKYDVNMSNGLSDIEQNHWTMKYRSQWLTIILRSKVVSYIS